MLLSGEELNAERIAAEVESLIEQVGAGMEGAEPEVSFQMRYRGQAFELDVPGGRAPDPDELGERFAAAHEERYGYRDPEGSLEIVDVRLAMVVPGPAPRPRAAGGEPPAESERRARMGGEWVAARVLRGEPPAGLEAEGPAIFELPESTLVLPPGWRARVDEAGSVLAARGEPGG